MLRCAVRSTSLLQYPSLILILSPGDFCVLRFLTSHLQATFILFFFFFLLDVNCFSLGFIVVSLPYAFHTRPLGLEQPLR